MQRAYSAEEIKILLQEAGMEFLQAFDSYSEEPPGTESQRIVILAREQGKSKKME